MRWPPIVLACALLAGCDLGGGDPASPAAERPAAPELAAGEERVFGAGVLAVGDLVRCRAGGIVAETRLQTRPTRMRAFKQTAHAFQKDGSTATLSLDVRPTGRVVATCST